MKVSFIKTRNIIFLIILIFGAVSGGYILGAKGFEADLGRFPVVSISRQLPPEKHLDFTLFWKVWDTLEASYFDKTKIIPAKLIYGAIKGMVAAVGDPYTVFLPPDENKVVSEDLEGNFEGVGIQIGFKGTQLTIIAPLPETPAEKSGIKAGDYLIGIKDEKKNIDIGTVGLSLPEAVRLIRGPAGSRVTLTLLRKGEEKPIVIELTRAAISVPSVKLSYRENESIAVVELVKFSADTQGEWDKIVSEMLNSQVTALVLDLRNNPGGFLQGAVDIASEFIKSGVIVIEENAKGEKTELKVSKAGRLVNIPLVVLVNEGSASASEILAGALKDNKRAKIVGETTFGKGSIQEPQELNGGSSLHITTSRWLTPTGYWVDEKGLEPDVKIGDNEVTEEDEQLKEAIRLLQ
ncbi:S41 family peptidase [Candidatus Woesebacteria bacterium]|nr:S41 family peptidase [Candidatus Woesebacteria bacterium]